MPRRAGGRRAPSFALERTYARRGCALIAGIDEAGRGALAGPLSVGLVAFPASLYHSSAYAALSGIRDSKQLSPRQREEAARIVRSHAVLCATVFVSHAIIDEININRATEFGIRKMLRTLSRKPDCLLLDGTYAFEVGVPLVSIVQGDARSFSIAAASILAKVARDEVMRTIDRRYPGYCFRENMGYGTGAHRAAIAALGPTPVHRLTYDPLRSLLTEGAVSRDAD